MANKIISFVIDTLEADLDPILAAGINAIEKEGHKLKELRVTSDSGEVKVAPNMVAGVVVHDDETQPSLPPGATFA